MPPADLVPPDDSHAPKSWGASRTARRGLLVSAYVLVAAAMVGAFVSFHWVFAVLGCVGVVLWVLGSPLSFPANWSSRGH
jgi:hypothetical protein